MTVRLALALALGAAIGGSVLTRAASAEDADLHHPPKAGKPAAHGAAPKSAGGGAAGIAAGLFGAAIGAGVVDALTRANEPDAGPAPAPAAGCHYETQPLFDASGQQVASRRVRVCN
jgi:hypothetical protein